jgi:thiol-disulfide isomerase/thioredoxin
MPTDGIVRETGLEVTKGKTSDVEKVRAVYDWILANTYREPKVRGCGVGDIKTMLETRNFGGKCGDINGLFVGLVRSVGVPARDVYGIRVAPSAFGYKSLGAGSANISRAQHCRAEVFLKGYGWVAMDPADVTKVAREKTSEWLKIDHPLVEAVRPKLFGGWEGNWVAFNTAHDGPLPNATQVRSSASCTHNRRRRRGDATASTRTISSTRSPRASRLSILALGGIVCAGVLLAGNVRADSTRFIPWKEPTAPPLALNDLAGQARTLAEYRGRLVLLNFWATWCEPCRDEMASIHKLLERLSGRPFAVLLVNYGESRARVAEVSDPSRSESGRAQGVASPCATVELPGRPGWSCAIQRDRRDRLGEP